MGKGVSIDTLLRPLITHPLQCYLGTGLHTLGLLGWILKQTGRANVYVSTFSTSDAFLSGFLRLKKAGLVEKSILVADLKASRKTVQLYKLMNYCFDSVHLAQNHSKVVLVENEQWAVTVISSQNQTYGDRAECTMITTDYPVFEDVYDGLAKIVDKSLKLDELFGRLSERHRDTGEEDDEANGDSIHPGAE